MTSDAAVRIRPEHDEDRAEVTAVIAAAFGADEPEVPRLTEALRPHQVWQERPRPELSVVAVSDDAVVGHVLLTRGWVDAWERMVPVLVLSPLSVHPDHQGRGTGTRLVAAAVGTARAIGAPAVFLEGSPRYYGRRGFTPAGPLGFGRPSHRIPAPAFQVALLPAHEPWMTGTLVYPAPFWELDCVGLRDRALVERIEAG